jgi:hypothetical protein
MRAIEAFGEIDKDGRIKLEKPIDHEGRKVKVIILFPEEENIDDASWLEAVSKSESFDFLKEEGEDIYSVEDGKTVSDEA